MIIISNIFHKIVTLHKKKLKGFILPLTLVILAITLAVSTGISTILIKELFFSRVSRDSGLAYYTADEGLSCAIYIDDTYVDPATGLGIFQYNDPVTPDVVLTAVNANRTSRGLTPIPAVTNIKCATSLVFDPAAGTSNYVVTAYSRQKADLSTENGKTTNFTMIMDLADGTTRCAKLTINKTATFRQIISRGYTTCDTQSPKFIERAVINTTELN